MDINFNGFNENVVTFEAESTLTKPGVLVKVVENGKVAPAKVNDKFCGVTVNVRNGYAAVALSGYVTLPAVEKCEVGYKNLSVDTNGKVLENLKGKEYLVVDSTEESIGFIL